MLRVTGGYLRGRRVASPVGAVRPTQERVREALFSMIADRMAGARFLDLYAGSGIVSLEACSRGAASVTAVERDRIACDRLRRQIDAIAPGGEAGVMPRVVRDDVGRFLRRLAAAGRDARYDLVFADPPYGGADGTASDRVAWLATALAAARLPADGGIWIMETRARGPLTTPAPAPWRLLTDRVYGETRLALYCKK